MVSTTLDDPKLERILKGLHSHDRKNHWNFMRAAVPFLIDQSLGRKTPQAVHAKRDRKIVMSITPAAGQLIYLTARAIGAKRIVEFGSSFGVSTLYLAAAVRDNGGGIVIGSELEPSKVEEARKNIAGANLTEFADIRAGDAVETLSDPGGLVDMVLLDGAKELYFEVLQKLLPHIRTGAVVLADDAILFRKTMASYLQFVRNSSNDFRSVTLPLGAGLEYSVKL
ncbi:MAG: class I SAM-dependent methyltransferase [Acidobacteriia bacterium]|nr:class I SAM-dependent methyltransferase [Terriglobia bacterium]